MQNDLARLRLKVHSVEVESDADPRSSYVPIGGSHMARTPEELAEVFAGFPERIAELRLRRLNSPLTPEEQEDLRVSEEILTRSAPWLLPPE